MTGPERRVVLLRDVINSCIGQAAHEEVLTADDPRMRTIKAYIMAQKKGVKLNYGKR